MLLPHPADRPTERTSDQFVTARRWRRMGLAGAVLTAVAATSVGDLPTTNELGAWPTLIWPHPRAWPAVVLAYLGLTLVIGAWWQLGNVTRGLPQRLGFMLRTSAMWAVPFAIAPPLYSRDIYSYLAQGALYASGLDPYQVGPSALGGPLASNVSTIWQDTPAPYGPLFLGIAALVTAFAGHHIVLAVLMMRVVMIGALAVTTACMIPLARRVGVDPATAVWLGVLNPLTLAHVVSGAHNDALMVMLMIAGILLAVRERPVAASVVLGLAVLVKLPAAVALAVVVPAMSRRLRGRYPMARGGLAVAATAVLTVATVTVLMGTWYGWVSALSDTARIRNGLSITTNVGIVINALAWFVGQGTGSVDVVGVAREVGVATAAVLTLLVLARTRGRPVYALALIMFSVVLLGPVVHPWYLLWGIVPLAVSTRDPRVVTRVALLIIGLVLYPMPWGEGFSPAAWWGLIGTATGLLVISAVGNPQKPWDPVPPEPATLVPPLHLQAR
ncbi:MAG TPA: polyprenol phosphomannose-dependent alpha 1,6 mannosyltransferase MptB [Kineosporiaceae bacterium]